MLKTLGFIVNPIAGLGGSVGLKGTDGRETARKALELGAEARAPVRAALALREVVAEVGDIVRVVAPPGAMGEDVARAAGLVPDVIGSPTDEPTSGADTENAARAMRDRGVDLLVFVGGDGTARNVCAAVGESAPVLGIPAGVKMHSAVYATNPRTAGALIARFLREGRLRCHLREVMDLDEDAYRQGVISARLFGYLSVPVDPERVQSLKARSPAGEDAALAGIARDVVERMSDGRRYVLGPGTTVRAVADLLGVPKTLIGVDVVERGALIASDVSEREILDLIAGSSAAIVVTPIGGQGYLFGRGNQQISARVIERVGRANIIVVAAPSKMTALQGRPFLVDTGDELVDATLAGYVRVITGYRAEAVYRVR